jgi:hypothetical protein
LVDSAQIFHFISPEANNYLKVFSWSDETNVTYFNQNFIKALNFPAKIAVGKKKQVFFKEKSFL